MRTEPIHIGDLVKLTRECMTVSGIRFNYGRVMIVQSCPGFGHPHYHLQTPDGRQGIGNLERNDFELVEASNG